jgi:hypothetical protein
METGIWHSKKSYDTTSSTRSLMKGHIPFCENLYVWKSILALLELWKLHTEELCRRYNGKIFQK